MNATWLSGAELTLKIRVGLVRMLVTISALILTSCQTMQQKDFSVVQDRITKLQPLSNWPSVQCRASATVTEPARARYGELFASESKLLSEPSWNYLWRARQTDCEILASEKSPMLESHQSLMQTVFCLMLQTHYVNSPFDELKVTPDQVGRRTDILQIQTGGPPDLGIFVDPAKFEIETRTKSRGTFTADYTDRFSTAAWMLERWLPERVELQNSGTRIVVDGFEYSPTAIAGRTMLQALTIRVGF